MIQCPKNTIIVQAKQEFNSIQPKLEKQLISSTVVSSKIGSSHSRKGGLIRVDLMQVILTQVDLLCNLFEFTKVRLIGIDPI